MAESQRTRIVAALKVAVAEHGFLGTSIADVTNRAGVSRKTFYQQFGGKDEAFAFAAGDELDRLVAVTMAAFEGDEHWVDRLRSALTALCAALAANPAAARLCFVEAPAAGPVTFARRAEALRGLLPLFEEAPDDTMRDLAFRESLSLGRIGDLSEMLHQEIAAGATTGLPRLVPQLAYMMVLPYMGPERAARELMGARRLRPAS